MVVTPSMRIIHGLKDIAAGARESFLRRKRVFARADVDTKVTVFFQDRAFEGRLRDVSISGAMLEPDFGMDVGAELELELPNISGRVKAQVMRLSENGAGVKFSNPNIGILIAGWSRGTSATPPKSTANETRG